MIGIKNSSIWDLPFRLIVTLSLSVCAIPASAQSSCMFLTDLDDKWRQIGLPCEPSDSAVDVVFSELGEYGIDWILYEWDPVNQQTVALSADSNLSQGTGYWLYDVDETADVDLSGNMPPTAPCPDGAGYPEGTECFALPLVAGVEPRWVMISNPFPVPIAWGNVRFRTGILDLTPSEAAFFGLFWKEFWHYTGNDYAVFDDDEFAGTLQPGDGFWVRAQASAFHEDREWVLLVPNIPPLTLPDETSAMDTDDWRVHLQVEADDMLAANNFLGWHPESRRRYDKRDLFEPPPFAEPYLTFVFPHPDWHGVRTGDYTTDFHPTVRLRRNDTWTFEIRSDQANRQAKLSWEGPPEVLENSVIVDLETGDEIPADDGEYSFELAETTHSFRWQYTPNR